MARNLGKPFENVIRKSFEAIKDTSVLRLPDQMSRYRGSKNICDFLIYKYPYEYYIECKTTKGNRLPFSNISKDQWQGLLKKSKIPGVIAGVIVWFIDKDVTMFIPIQTLEYLRQKGKKSIPYFPFESVITLGNGKICEQYDVVKLVGRKKRKYFEYDMEQFFKEVTKYVTNDK